MVDLRRVRARNEAPAGNGSVLYLMRRDQRAHDNWALLYAQETALARKVPLIVVFSLSLIKERATLRNYRFMLEGLREVEPALTKLGITFVLAEGSATDTVQALVKKFKIGEVVTDFNPLKRVEAAQQKLAKSLSVRLTEVDAHNIAPCWYASPKQEFAAYTFRPKLQRLLPEFLTEFPKLVRHPHVLPNKAEAIDWGIVEATLRLKQNNISPFISGEKAASTALVDFVSNRLSRYHLDRNDPTKNGLSNLSPYLHFGQLSAQRVALAVIAARAPKDAKDAFIEELTVRKELSDNYCHYNPVPDKLEGAPAWAQKTLKQHANDVREHIYTKAQFESGETHDELWNAMQQQLLEDGKLHGWCRMYWAKKILEWTPDVQAAIDTALELNDLYELDGGDPNGIVGVMWSMCGVHDRAWNERPIFGKIRYMNFAGAKRKFDIKAYIERYGKSKTLFE